MSNGLRVASGLAVGLFMLVAIALASVGADDGTVPEDGHADLAVTAAVAHAGPLQDPEYEGGRSGCRRCHLREYRSWEDTPHAGAFETLPEEERTNPDCVKCHVTGWGEPTGFTSIEETPELAGVQCEVCHGPGSLYKDREVMKDHQASVDAGLLIPDEQTCLSCHNEESPHFPGSFDYEEMLEKGVHERKQ